MAQEQTFFDFAAEVGLTKHLGSVGATDELAALCRIEAGKTVLDVGCGAGQTACYLAKRYHCRVVGVDIRLKMVEHSRERAQRAGLSDRVTFRTADAQDLPFGEAEFDAVITESVTAFPADKALAVREYARVTIPGGWVGLNESTWLKTPVPEEMTAWVAQDTGATVTPLTEAEWRGLLEAAGLKEIVVKVNRIDTQDEARGILRRYGCLGLAGILWRTLRLYLRSPAYRRFVKGVREVGVVPESISEYFGYGLYVGQK